MVVVTLEGSSTGPIANFDLISMWRRVDASAHVTDEAHRAHRRLTRGRHADVEGGGYGCFALHGVLRALNMDYGDAGLVLL